MFNCRDTKLAQSLFGMALTLGYYVDRKFLLVSQFLFFELARHDRMTSFVYSKWLIRVARLANWWLVIFFRGRRS